MKDSHEYDNTGFDSHGETVVNVSPQQDKTITYSWHKVNVFAEKQKRLFDRQKKDTNAEAKKHILKDVSGICRPGELVAIMGASGAGKTTLLNVLTGRSSKALDITGDLFVNGTRVSPDQLTSRSAYVQQEDLFIGTLTVREMLVFQAQLRMDKGIPLKRRMEIVDEVLVELGLKKCADNMIGVPGRIKGISGGEMKRLAFACEVLTDPPLMFCDEPTTGLDSFMAQTIVQAMKRLAESKHKTIISTIHQPSSEVFALFDRVFLLAEGRVAFLGLTSEALKFMHGEGKICPKKYNPADFFISTLAIQPGREAESRKTVHTICDHFKDSSQGISMIQDVQANMKARQDTFSISKKNQTYKASWMGQMVAVLKRSCLEVIREPMVLRVKLFQTIIVALLIGIVFLGQEVDQAGITNINGATFLLLTNLSFSGTFNVVNVFCGQLPIFFREHFNGMYRTDVYFIAKNISETPLAVFTPALFTAVVYYMVGFNPDVDRFFICMGILILVSNIALSFGYFVSCLASTLDMALAVAAPLLIPLMLFGGFFINSDSVPVYFIWLKYISWFNYGNEALMINQWKGIGDIPCNFNITPPQFCKYTGSQVLEDLGYNEDNLGFDIGMLFVLFFSFRILGMLILVRKSYAQQ